MPTAAETRCSTSLQTRLINFINNNYEHYQYQNIGDCYPV